jgi:hypothetical protein
MTSPAAPAKKGMKPLAWVGIGCGGLLLLGIIAGIFGFVFLRGKIAEMTANPERTQAEMLVAFHPDLEMVSSDAEKGEMTIRTKGGETKTLTYKEIAEGRAADPADQEDLPDMPEWVPVAPGMTDGIRIFHREDASGVSGQFTGRTTQGVAETILFFDGEAERLGLNNKTSGSMDGGETSTATLGYSGGKRTLNIAISKSPGEETLVSTNYSEKN